jgi:uncharacterized protein YukE
VVVDDLDIVPEQVYQAAAVGRARHEELAGTYASTQSQAWDAETGWVGRSGAALSALLDRWQSDAAGHHRLLNDHHDGLYTATSMLVGMDRLNAEKLILVDDDHAR